MRSNTRNAPIAGVYLPDLAGCSLSRTTSNLAADKWDIQPQDAMKASVEQRARKLSSCHTPSREHGHHLNTVGSGQRDLAKLQDALRKGAFNPGTADGRLGDQTLTAVRDSQRRLGIAAGRLTMETLQGMQVR